MEKRIYQVLERLESSGYQAYLVGGYVRNLFLSIDSYDVDICTNARPKELCDIFKEYSVTTSIYGTVTFHLDKYKFEITTFRKESSYKDHRRPDSIMYVDDLMTDLKRRDFKMNAICMDKEGNIIDPYNGRLDIKNKVITCIKDPYSSLEEDSLRLLRAIRFAAILNFKIDKKLEDAIIDKKELLRDLSYIRKKEELNKIFFSSNKRIGVSLLKKYNLIDELDLINIDYVLKTNDLLGMWAYLQKEDLYPFNKNEKDIMKKIRQLMDEDLSDPYVLYNYGSYPLSIVCDLKGISKRRLIHKYDKLPIKSRSEIALGGDEICSLLHRDDGTYIKQVFDDLEEKILFKKLKNDPKKIREYIINNY